jgi:cytochrome c biogenesis protein CcmG, thiol:disulfide interchange protein DsbE
MKLTQQSYTRLLYGFLLLLGLGWIWLSAIPANAVTNGKIPAPQTGFLAPDFTAKTFGGNTIQLADLRGKVVLINFWASWCPPCRAEMPAIEHVFQNYKNQRFMVMAINSTIQDTVANAHAFAIDGKLSFPIFLDESGEIIRLYHIQSLPTSFFIGPDGIIREIVMGGPMSEALLSTRIEQLLKELP